MLAEAGASTAMELTLPHDLSPWGMFMHADIVVKAVMVGLAFASLVTWTIWLAKSWRARRRRASRARPSGRCCKRTTLSGGRGPMRARGGPVAALVGRGAEETRPAIALDHLRPTG